MCVLLVQCYNYIISIFGDFILILYIYLFAGSDVKGWPVVVELKSPLSWGM